MSERLAIRTLTIKHTAGFPNDRLPAMEFCDGINIVFGPNASGKTTTARAIQALLWPRSGRPDTFLTAEIALGGRIGHFTCSGNAREPAEGFTLPEMGDPTFRHRYMLAQHELLSAQETGADFAQEILNEARGGLDLAQVEKLLGYRQVGNVRQSQELLAARTQYAETRDAEKRTHAEEERLADLQRQLAAAQAAQAELERWNLALDYQGTVAREAQLRVALEQFPAELAQLTGRELEALDEANRQLANEAKEEQAAEDDIAAAQDEIGRAALADPAAAEQAIATLKASLEELTRLDDDLRRAHDAYRNSETATRSAYKNLGGEDRFAHAQPLDAGVVQQLESCLQRAEGLAAERAALEAQLGWLASLAPASAWPQADTAREAIRHLDRWLAAGAGAPPSRMPYAAIGISALLALAGIFAAALDQSIFGGIAAVLGLMLLFLSIARARPRTGGATRQELAEQFAQFGLNPPATWSEADVAQYMKELEAAIASLTLAAAVAQKGRELALQRGALDEKEDALAPERARIAALLGAAPTQEYAATPGALLYWVRQFIEWQQQRALLASAQAQCQALEEARAAALQRSTLLLTPFGYPPAEESAAVRGALQHLEGRFHLQQRAAAKLDDGQRRRDYHQRQRTQMERRRAEMIARIGLPADPEAARARLIVLQERFAQYTQAQHDLQAAVAVRVEAADKIQRLPEWESLVALETAALQRQQVRAQEEADAIASLSDQIGACKQRIATAKEQAACEQAQAAFARALDKQRQKLEETLQAAVGWQLMRELESHGGDAELPAVFLRAKRLFETFTHGRYALTLDRQQNAFSAYDRLDQAERPLEALSSGTRVQLLMAVRLAFVEVGERDGTPLPLLMDETLASSDETRERAIIDTALAICRAGRQVFYFTGKSAEMAQWRQLAEEQGLPVRIIDLSETPAPRATPPPPRTPLPAPDGMTHRQYGEALRVPPLDFASGGAACAHLWYLLEDPAALHTLLTHDIIQCGQLHSPYIMRVLAQLLGSAAAQKMRALCEMLEEMERLWQEGRGKPLTMQALTESDAFSELFMDKIAALADAYAWDAQALATALQRGEVKRLHKKNIDQFIAFCAEQGYIVEGIPLAAQEIRERTLAAAVTRCADQVLSLDEVTRLCDRALATAPA